MALKIMRAFPGEGNALLAATSGNRTGDMALHHAVFNFLIMRLLDAGSRASRARMVREKRLSLWNRRGARYNFQSLTSLARCATPKEHGEPASQSSGILRCKVSPGAASILWQVCHRTRGLRIIAQSVYQLLSRTIEIICRANGPREN